MDNYGNAEVLLYYNGKMSVGYDGKLLIEEVEIMLRKGEILTLLGPNGAGKSTILKSIARQLSLIAGTVRLDGEDMKSLTGAELSKKWQW